MTFVFFDSISLSFTLPRRHRVMLARPPTIHVGVATNRGRVKMTPRTPLGVMVVDVGDREGYAFGGFENSEAVLPALVICAVS